MTTNNRFMTIAVALAMCAAVATAAHGQRRADRDSDGSDEYRIIEERNIFLRDRSTPTRTRRPEPPTPRPEPRPERDWVLRGIVRRDGEFVAFFENRRNGETTIAKVGDSIVRGSIATIELDYIEYAREDETSRVKLGMDLEGDGPASAAASRAPASDDPPEEASATAPDDSPPERDAPTDDSPASILERLRQRRQRELQQ